MPTISSSGGSSTKSLTWDKMLLAIDLALWVMKTQENTIVKIIEPKDQVVEDEDRRKEVSYVAGILTLASFSSLSRYSVKLFISNILNDNVFEMS